MAIMNSTTIQHSPVLSSPNIAPTMVKQAVQPHTQVATAAMSLAQAKTEAQPSEQKVQRSVAQANISMSGSNETIAFGYEEKLGQLYVQVTDKESGELIREIPSKEFLQHKVYMREMVGLLLDRQV